MNLRRDFIKIPLGLAVVGGEQAFGGWGQADQAHFRDGASFDQIDNRK